MPKIKVEDDDKIKIIEARLSTLELAVAKLNEEVKATNAAVETITAQSVHNLALMSDLASVCNNITLKVGKLAALFREHLLIQTASCPQTDEVAETTKTTKKISKTGKNSSKAKKGDK